MFRQIVPAIGVLLSACANVPSDYKLDASRPVGLVVGTITYASSGGSYRIVVVPDRPGPFKGEDVRTLQVGSTQWSPFAKTFDEQLKAKGDTFAVEFPEGNYVINSWLVIQGPRRTTSTKRIDIPFRVEAGAALYLGAFNWDAHWENISLADQSDRDLPILHARYPTLDSSPITASIAKGSELENLGGSYTYRYQAPLFMPILRR